MSVFLKTFVGLISAVGVVGSVAGIVLTKKEAEASETKNKPNSKIIIAQWNDEIQHSQQDNADQNVFNPATDKYSCQIQQKSQLANVSIRKDEHKIDTSKNIPCEIKAIVATDEKTSISLNKLDEFISSNNASTYPINKSTWWKITFDASKVANYSHDTHKQVFIVFENKQHIQLISKFELNNENKVIAGNKNLLVVKTSVTDPAADYLYSMNNNTYYCSLLENQTTSNSQSINRCWVKFFENEKAVESTVKPDSFKFENLRYKKTNNLQYEEINIKKNQYFVLYLQEYINKPLTSNPIYLYEEPDANNTANKITHKATFYPVMNLFGSIISATDAADPSNTDKTLLFVPSELIQDPVSELAK